MVRSGMKSSWRSHGYTSGIGSIQEEAKAQESLRPSSRKASGARGFQTIELVRMETAILHRTDPRLASRGEETPQPSEVQ